VLGSTLRRRRLPRKTQAFSSGSAVFQIQVYEALIGNASLFCHFLEVGNRAFVEANRDGLLELRGVRVLPCVAEVTVLAHVGSPIGRWTARLRRPSVQR
jgi:hypothetical protein